MRDQTVEHILRALSGQELLEKYPELEEGGFSGGVRICDPETGRGAGVPRRSARMNSSGLKFLIDVSAGRESKNVCGMAKSEPDASEDRKMGLSCVLKKKIF